MPFKFIVSGITLFFLGLQLNLYGSSFMIHYELKIKLDTVKLPEQAILNTGYLKPGIRQYIVFTTDTGVQKRLDIRIWQRDISIEKSAEGDVFVTRQTWLSYDSSKFTQFLSVNNLNDFKPRFHSQESHGHLFAYNWYSDSVVGADSVLNNLKAGFKIKLNWTALNWNLDLETIEMLPMDHYKNFYITFYDAGIGMPQKLLYTVVGEEAVSLYNCPTKLKCWKLLMKAEFKGMHFTETFWVTKDSHELIKEKDDLGNGKYRYKIRLPDVISQI